MKHPILLFLTIALFGNLGCNNRQKAASDKAVQAIEQSFNAAPEELKTKYQSARTAIDKGDFVKAKTNLDELFKAGLSPEQQLAISELKQKLMIQASVAAQNGDATAAKIVQEVRSQSRSR
jgi:Tfp pilus assembly protein PilF